MRKIKAILGSLFICLSCTMNQSNLKVTIPSKEEFGFDYATCTAISSSGAYQLTAYTNAGDLSKNVILNITITDLQNPSVKHVEFCKMASSNESDYSNSMEGKFALKTKSNGVFLNFKNVKFKLSDGIYVINGQQFYQNSQ